MKPPNNSPAVFYLQHRRIILASAPFVIAFSYLRILSNLRSEDPWLNWLVALILWVYLLTLAFRRRLVLTELGLEYTDFFTTTRIPWSQVTRLVSRKILGIWPVEGLEVWVASPRLQEFLVDLTQFSKSWRQTALGSILRARLPQLFKQSAASRGAA